MLSQSIVIVAPEGKLDGMLASCEHAEVLDHVEKLSDLPQTVANRRPDFLLVSIEIDADLVFSALERLPAPRPLLILYGPDDSRLILRSMRAGAFEYVAPAPDEQEQLADAIRRGASRDDGECSEAPLITLIGAKGGVGTSFVACQLAAALSGLGGRVALVDGHLRHGDVALYLDLAPRYNLASIATGQEPLDATYLRTALVSHASGVAVLAAPSEAEEGESMDAGRIDAVIELMRREFDWVLWDAPQDFDERNLCAIDRSRPVVLVTNPDVPALNHTRMQLELLARLGHPTDEVRIVLNRDSTKAPVSSKDAAEFLKRPIDAAVPNDYPRAAVCVNEGRTLSDCAPRSSIERGVQELARCAHAWCDRPLPKSDRRSLFDRLRGK